MRLPDQCARPIDRLPGWGSRETETMQPTHAALVSVTRRHQDTDEPDGDRAQTDAGRCPERGGKALGHAARVANLPQRGAERHRKPCLLDGGNRHDRPSPTSDSGWPGHRAESDQDARHREQIAGSNIWGQHPAAGHLGRDDAGSVGRLRREDTTVRVDDGRVAGGRRANEEPPGFDRAEHRHRQVLSPGERLVAVRPAVVRNTAGLRTVRTDARWVRMHDLAAGRYADRDELWNTRTGTGGELLGGRSSPCASAAASARRSTGGVCRSVRRFVLQR